MSTPKLFGGEYILKSFVRLVAVTIALLVTALPDVAFASDEAVPTEVTSIPGHAPFSIQSCAFYPNEFNGFPFLNIESTNLNPSRMLERIQVHVQLYDDIHSKTAQTTIESTGMDLDPGQTNRGRLFFKDGHDISIDGVHSAVCTIKSVTFDGGSTWRAGIPWTGKIIKQDASNENGVPASGSSSISSSRASGVTIEKIGSVWPDALPDGAFLHARIRISVSMQTSLQSRNLHLAIASRNGITQQLTGLDRAAPLVLKQNLLLGTSDSVPQVKPQEDFGALGRITIQPGAPVTVVATFLVPAALLTDGVNAGDVTF